MFAGIDVGQRRIHVVVLGASLRLVDERIVEVHDLERLTALLRGAAVVAIDAPEALSTCPHLDDLSLSPKFRSARCAEVALGRAKGLWVPWVTPAAHQHLPPWMSVGFDLFDAARRRVPTVVEVYPYAGFRVLGASRLASKRTREGREGRAELLARAGVTLDARTHTHDSLDASLAAMVAQQVGGGSAEKVTCGHDGSAIWLPARPAGLPSLRRISPRR